jgi:hypothetical protein
MKTFDPFEIFSKFTFSMASFVGLIHIPSKNSDLQNVLANTTRRKTTSIYYYYFSEYLREEFFPRTCHCPGATPPLKNQLFVPLLFLRYLHFSDESPVIIPLNGSILFTFMSFTSRSRKIHGIRCIVNDRLPRSICHSLGFNCFRRKFE